jgi:hypothetical protein
MLPFYLERLEGTATRLLQKVTGYSDGILSYRPEGKWSVKQNIGHLAEVDTIGHQRIGEMLTGVPVLSPAVFDTRQDYNAQTIDQVIALFAEGRLRNLRQYRRLSEGDLLKSSLHPRLRVQMTPVDLALFDADHDDHHLVAIKGILARHT